MNFVEFQKLRTRILAENPAIVDFAETNIWRSLASLVPSVRPAAKVPVHRCHLAEAWLRVFQLPHQQAKYAMVTSGVRHSLSLLLPELAKSPGTLMIPEDVYPVYGQIAQGSGIRSQTFPTVPALQLPENARWLLLPNPLKPAGRWLNQDEVDTILRWLSADTDRRVLIDAVYNFQTQIHATSLRLLQSGKAFLLHSLSKAWLAPQMMGICLVPESDWPELAPVFRDHSPEQPELFNAQVLMKDQQELPAAVAAEILVRRQQLQLSWPADLPGLVTEVDQPGYLFPVAASFESLLESHQILTIPLTVFGSAAKNISVVSSLRCATLHH